MITQKTFFAQKAFIINHEKILLVQKSSDDPDHPGRWEVPGGRMEFGEGVDEHLKREVMEEVGLDVDPGVPFFLWEWRLNRTNADGHPIDIQIVAVARICKTHSIDVCTEYRVEGDFLDVTRWVHFDDLLMYDFIPNMLPVVHAFIDIVKSNP